jgi:hypothetical protein
MTAPASPPDAELLIATGCAHCPVVLEGLAQLVKEGVIGRLQVTNIVVHPEVAEALGVRSVPWLRLGPFVLEGLHSVGELRDWARRSGSREGVTRYLEEQLKQGKLAQTEAWLREHPQWLEALIPLLEEEDTDIKVRIGVDALLESLADSLDLSPLVPELARLSRAERRNLRSDAVHYLALTRSPEALPHIEARLEDESEEVREFAAEALDELRAALAEHA